MRGRGIIVNRNDVEPPALVEQEHIKKCGGGLAAYRALTGSAGWPVVQVVPTWRANGQGMGSVKVQ